MIFSHQGINIRDGRMINGGGFGPGLENCFPLSEEIWFCHTLVSASLEYEPSLIPARILAHVGFYLGFFFPGVIELYK